VLARRARKVLVHAETAAPTARACADTLYYDGQCPLCSAEIEALHTARGEALRLVDIHSLPAATSDLPAADALLRTLHLRRGDGQWLRGADANAAAWEGTLRGRLLRVLRWPLLRLPVDAAYAGWARWRYRRLYGRHGTVRDAA
jgi:predicted DCC family thiol-disulfide oxidoreductase YuxK